MKSFARFINVLSVSIFAATVNCAVVPARSMFEFVLLIFVVANSV